MERSEISNEQRDSLLHAILPIVLKKGPSHTTMDHVATSLGMSKRTLYEIFGSKDDLLCEVVAYHYNIGNKKAEEIFRNSANMMEALVKINRIHQEFLESTSPDFFKDMDEKYKHLRPHYDTRNNALNSQVAAIVKQGIKEGMFRMNCDYELNLRLLKIQLESIKRMEDYFPPEITIGQAYHTITEGFLRSIATQKGVEYLDSLDKAAE